MSVKSHGGVVGLLVLALAIVMPAASPALAAAQPTPEPLNIGFIGSFSGVDSSGSQDALDGFKLGIKHLGGRLGGVEFDLTVLDDKQDAGAAQRALRRLLHDAKPQVILLATEPAITLPLASDAASVHSFMISLGPPAPALAGKACNSYFFSLAGLLETQQEQAGIYMEGQGYKRVVLAEPANAHAQVEGAAFRLGFHGEVLEVKSKRGAMSFAGDLARIRKLAPDAVYLLHTGGMAINFIRQWNETKLKGNVPLYGSGALLEQPYLSAAGADGLGLLSVAPWSEDTDTPSNKRLMSDFEGEYGRPASSYAARGYDAAMLLDAAIRQIDHKYNEDDAMRTALRNVDYPSTRGTLRFDTNQFPIQSYYLRGVVEIEANVRGHYANETRGLVARDVRDGNAADCPMRWTPTPMLIPQPEPKR